MPPRHDAACYDVTISMLPLSPLSRLFADCAIISLPRQRDAFDYYSCNAQVALRSLIFFIAISD